MIYILDTHAIVWFLENDPRLGQSASGVFYNPHCRLGVPSIVYCELRHLAKKKKMEKSFEKISEYMKSDPRFELLPLDEGVVDCLEGQLDIHDDIIVATALSFQKQH